MELMYIIISPRQSNAGKGIEDFRVVRWVAGNNVRVAQEGRIVMKL